MLNNTSHPYRKKWGQNFLRDPNIIEKIISSLKPDKQDHILEVGPGDGALTHSLYSKVCKIYAVEIDPLLIQHLKEQHRWEIQCQNELMCKQEEGRMDLIS